MFKPYLKHIPFVCLSDLYTRGSYIEYNPVIYNPKLSNEENEKIVRDNVLKYFGLHLTDISIKKLITLQPEDFIAYLKNILKSEKIIT